MRLKQVHRLPVIDECGRVVGVLSLNDIACEAQRERAERRQAEISAASVAETLAAIGRPRNKHGFSIELDYVE